MDNDKIKKIGKRIRHLRKNNNITQEQLAEMIDVSVPYISNIENGKVTTSAEIIVRLTQALDTSADTILCLDGGDDESQAKILARMINHCNKGEMEQILEIIRIVTEIIENKYET